MILRSIIGGNWSVKGENFQIDPDLVEIHKKWAYTSTIKNTLTSNCVMVTTIGIVLSTCSDIISVVFKLHTVYVITNHTKGFHIHPVLTIKPHSLCRN